MILQRRNFARADYELLDEIGKRSLKKSRSIIAKKLNQERNHINNSLKGHYNNTIRKTLYEDLSKNAQRDARAERFVESATSGWDRNESIRRLEAVRDRFRARKAGLLGK